VPALTLVNADHTSAQIPPFASNPNMEKKVKVSVQGTRISFAKASPNKLTAHLMKIVLQGSTATKKTPGHTKRLASCIDNKVMFVTTINSAKSTISVGT
jgi:hypothetical protein